MVAALLLLPLLQAPAPATGASPARPPHEHDLNAFRALAAVERKELLDYLELELSHRGLFQVDLVHFVLKADGRDPAGFAERPPPQWFDPATHAPEQPIPRTPLEEADPRLVAARTSLLRPVGSPPAAPGFEYDYGRREVLRLPGWDDPLRVFANALEGRVPRSDLAEALVELQLDDGAQQKALAAFGHAYTDREGHVYGGITLFDAWASGAEIEMPDVDTLGILHVVEDDWKSFRAPVTRQKPLYDRLGAIYQAASRHRALRHALARVYLEAEPELGTYAGLRDNLHLAWERARSTPADLAPTLPASARWAEYLATLAEAGRKEPELWKAAEVRRATLAAGAEAVRATALAALEEFGAYKKLESGHEPERH